MRTYASSWFLARDTLRVGNQGIATFHENSKLFRPGSASPAHRARSCTDREGLGACHQMTSLREMRAPKMKVHGFVAATESSRIRGVTPRRSPRMICHIAIAPTGMRSHTRQNSCISAAVPRDTRIYLSIKGIAGAMRMLFFSRCARASFTGRIAFISTKFA